MPLTPHPPASPPGLEIAQLCFRARHGSWLLFGGWGDYEGQRCYRVEAWSPGMQERIAGVRLVPQEPGSLVSENMWVLENYRRRGLMSAMLDAVEYHERVTVVPSGDRTADAKQFWAARRQQPVKQQYASIA